jgi:2-polyprenyl-3-methyl-5-hydroxy-6-metoxy-1,4-benzoquinol methylase
MFVNNKINLENVKKFNLKDSVKNIINKVVDILFHGKANHFIDKKKLVIIIFLLLIILILLNQFYRYFVFKFILKKFTSFDINGGKYNNYAEIEVDEKFENNTEPILLEYLLPRMKKSLLTKWEYEYERDILDIKEGESILDISLSNGKLALYLLKHFNNLTITVITDEENFKTVEDKIVKFKDRVNLINCDIKTIEMQDFLKNQSYDKILLLNTIGKIKNKDAFLKSCNNSLKSNGKLYIKTVCYTDKNNFRFKDISNFWHYNFSTRYNICSELHNNGFKNIEYCEIDLLMLLLTYVPKDIILFNTALFGNIKYLTNSKVPTIKAVLLHIYIIFNGLKSTMIICDKA